MTAYTVRLNHRKRTVYPNKEKLRMARISPRKQLRPGDTFPGRTLPAVSGAAIPVPGAAELVHLQLRRFAGCPICNVHLHALTRRRAELDAAGDRKSVV